MDCKMELIDTFNEELISVYHYNGISNDNSDTSEIEIIICEESLEIFKERGKKAVNDMLNIGYSSEAIMKQRNVIVHDSLDCRADSLYIRAIKLLDKNPLGPYTKREFNMLAMNNFAMGADSLLNKVNKSYNMINKEIISK